MKNILPCILGMRIQDVLIMSFMEFIVHLSIDCIVMHVFICITSFIEHIVQLSIL